MHKLLNYLFDHFRYTPLLSRFATDASRFRAKVVSMASDLFITGQYTWANDPEFGTFENWVEQMSKQGVFADHYFLQFCCDILNRDIAIIPVFPEQVE